MLKSGAKREIWDIKTPLALGNQRFLLFASKFIDIRKSIKIQLIDMDVARMHAFKNYANFYQSYAEEKHPILLHYAAIKTRCLFVRSQRKIYRHNESFCLIIHHNLMEHLPLSEIISFNHICRRSSFHFKSYASISSQGFL